MGGITAKVFSHTYQSILSSEFKCYLDYQVGWVTYCSGGSFLLTEKGVNSLDRGVIPLDRGVIPLDR